MLDLCNAGNLSVTRATQNFFLSGERPKSNQSRVVFYVNLVEEPKPPSPGKKSSAAASDKKTPTVQFNRGMCAVEKLNEQSIALLREGVHCLLYS
jgi:hypothetical protein